MGSSEAALLQKLSIRPFTYGLVISSVYDSGSVFDAAVLDITDADMVRKFANACANIAAVSLELGFPTLASLPHSISNAFRALVAVVIEGCEKYSFPQADTVKVRPGACGSIIVSDFIIPPYSYPHTNNSQDTLWSFRLIKITIDYRR